MSLMAVKVIWRPTSKAFTSVFLNENGTLDRLNEDPLNGFFEYLYLVRYSFDRVNKGVDRCHDGYQIKNCFISGHLPLYNLGSALLKN
jgi:hypothetical protein